MSPDRDSSFGFGWDRKRGSDSKRRKSRKMFFEPLEPRQLLAVDVGDIAGFTANYYPPTRAQFASTSFLSAPAAGDSLTVALSYLNQNKTTFGLSTADLNNYSITNRYADTKTGISHIYLQQSYNGLPVADAVTSVNLMPNGQVITAGVNFVSGLSYPTTLTPLTPAITAQQAVSSFAAAAGLNWDGVLDLLAPATGRSQKAVYRDTNLSFDPIPVQLQYVPSPSGGLDLAWQMLVRTPGEPHMYDLAVAASGSRAGQVIRVADWLHNASYQVFPQSPSAVQDPLFGDRIIVTDPHDPVASPFGWHDNNGFIGPEFFDTQGNNVVAQADPMGNNTGTARPMSPTLDFSAPFDMLQQPLFNQDAGLINAFYWANLSHDVTARHGFDEAAGNFQTFNYTGAGMGFDPVILDTRDPVGGIPTGFGPFIIVTPEGTSPRINLGDNSIDIFTFNPIQPARDSAFDATIVAHEYYHGVTNRLVGGPSNVGATQAIQSGGMDEGWADWFGLVMTAKPGDNPNTPRTIGNWYFGQSISGPGIRGYPYSFDMTINPHTLDDFNDPPDPNLPFPFSNGGNETHNAGEIWASALWDMTWLLINQYGFDTNLFTGTGGQTRALDLVILGQKLVPANPSFTEARNAIIAADFALNQGDNYELIWEAFARRGFGVSSFVGPSTSTVVFEAFDRPPPLGRVRGTVFNDDNGNGVRNAGENPLAGWTVYVDANNNGVFDAAFETSRVTGPDGTYHFNFVNSQTVTIRQVVMPDWTQTLPSGGGGHTVFVQRGQTITGRDFGNRGLPGKISGLVWDDLSGDFVRDVGEPGIEGLVVFVDLNKDGKLGLLEPSAMTDRFGRYTISNVRPGSWTVKVLTQPGIPDFGSRIVAVDSNKTTSNINFPHGDSPPIGTLSQDWGDAPDSYGTTLANGGARHGILAGFHLGAQVTAEPNGQPSVGANADVGDDGIVFSSGPNAILTPGTTASITVTVSTGGFLPGKLHAWVDFNRNGMFDASERVIGNLMLGTGVHTVNFTVPAGLALGQTYARFRYGYEIDLGPKGPSAAGEVEDYVVTILGNTPVASPDSFPMPGDPLIQPGVTAVLNVLANDSGTTFGPPTIVPGSFPAVLPSGSTLTLNAAGDRILFTPGPSSFGVETFTYQVTDNSGRPPAESVSAPALVSVNITLSDPRALDDMVIVPFTTPPSTPPLVQIQALNNDIIPAPNVAATQIVSVQKLTVGVTGDSIAIAPGGKSLNFVPPQGFLGTIIYQYTINEVPDDPTTAPATGLITVQVLNVVGGVPQPAPSHQAQLVVDLLDFSTRQVLNANSVLRPGDFFYARMSAQDLRPGGDVATRGVDSAYLDLLFNRSVVQPVLSAGHPLGMNIVFDSNTPAQATSTVQATPTPTATSFAGGSNLSGADNFYVGRNVTFTSGALAGQTGRVIAYVGVTRTFSFGTNTFTAAPAAGDSFEIHVPQYSTAQNAVPNSPGPGSINEAGATRVPPGSGEHAGTDPAIVFTVLMRVLPGTVGQTVQVIGDPADLPTTRVIIAPDPPPDTIVLADEQVFLRPSPAIIVSSSLGGEFTNFVNRLDVNRDSFVAPDDAVLIINDLNRNGARALSMAERAAVGFLPPTIMIDTDADSYLTPTDALLVINYLNSLTASSRLYSGGLLGGEGTSPASLDYSLLGGEGARELLAVQEVAEQAAAELLLETTSSSKCVMLTMNAAPSQPLPASTLGMQSLFASSHRTPPASNRVLNEPLYQGSSRMDELAVDELMLELLEQ